MPHTKILCPSQCRAARGLLDWSQEDLASRAGVSRSTVRDFETGRHELHGGTERLLMSALRDGGVLLISPGDEAGDGAGAGVRLVG